MGPAPPRTTVVPQFPCHGEAGGGLWGAKWLNPTAAGAAGSPIPSPTGHGAPSPPAMGRPQPHRGGQLRDEAAPCPLPAPASRPPLSNAPIRGRGHGASPGRQLPITWGAREPPSKRPPWGRSHRAAAGDPMGGAPALWGTVWDPARGWRGAEGVPFVLGTKPRGEANPEPACCGLCAPRHRAHPGTTQGPSQPRPGNNRDATGRKVQGGWHRARDGVKGWGWRKPAAGSTEPLGGAAAPQTGHGSLVRGVGWGHPRAGHVGGGTEPPGWQGGLGTAPAAVNH